MNFQIQQLSEFLNVISDSLPFYECFTKQNTELSPNFLARISPFSRCKFQLIPGVEFIYFPFHLPDTLPKLWDSKIRINYAIFWSV